jgi:hypothetical protein
VNKGKVQVNKDQTAQVDFDAVEVDIESVRDLKRLETEYIDESKGAEIFQDKIGRCALALNTNIEARRDT